MVMLVIFMMMGALLMGNLVQGYLEDVPQLPSRFSLKTTPLGTPCIAVVVLVQ